MADQDDYCELCDLRLSQCHHGMPKPVIEPEAPKPAKTATPRKRASARTSATSATTKAGTTNAGTTNAGTSGASVARTTPTRGVTTRSTPAARKWTPPADFVPHIVAVLGEAGGSLESETALDTLEERVGDQLLPGDRERTPQGELRWRTAARKARRELVEAGVISADQPGVWQLNS